MKNLKIHKKTISLLLAGTISLCTLSYGINVKRHSNNDSIKQPEINIELQYEEATSNVQSSIEGSEYPEVSDDVVVPPTLEQEPIIEETNPVNDMVTGVVTYYDNIVNLSNDVTLINSVGYILDGQENTIRSYGEEFQITGINGRAVSLASLNIRKGPGTNYGKLDTMKNGTSLGVYGKTSNNWYLVNFNNLVGFVSGDYIQLLDVTYDEVNNEVIDNVPSVTLAVTPTTLVNIREGKSTDYKKIGQISGDRKYKVLEVCDNGWYKIDYNGREAYVSGKYVTETYMMDGSFYKFVYLKNDSYLYDDNGYQLREVSKYEGGKVYSEDDYFYLVSLGEDYGYIRKSDCKTIDGTIVNIDLNLQQLEIISNGEVVLTTDVVTGKDSTPSDIGLFTMGSPRYQTYLVGQGYKTYVNYFGAYNGGEGLHDAKWQNGHFGDVSYYHKGGSHGCINMPPDITPSVFDYVGKGTKVLVHK